MFPLFELVRERPIAERSSERPSCPYCQSRKLETASAFTTLVGGGDRNDPDEDPNHRHIEMRCLACWRRFMRELKYANVWYTTTDSDVSKVLRGMPSCFEGYVYTCQHCGGDIQRRYTEMDGVEPVRGGLHYSAEHGAEFRTFFDCMGCGRTAETTPHSHWYPGIEDLPPIQPEKRPVRTEQTWRIKMSPWSTFSDAINGEFWVIGHGRSREVTELVRRIRRSHITRCPRGHRREEFVRESDGSVRRCHECSGRVLMAFDWQWCESCRWELAPGQTPDTYILH